MIKKILKIALLILLVLILLFSVTIALGAILRDENLLSPWGTGFFIIASGSMQPTMPVGSIVYVKAVAPEEIKVDDVITFFIGTSRTIVLTHRVRDVIVDENGYSYVTRGDANNVDDHAFGYDMVVGRVAYVIPGNSLLIRVVGNVKYVGIAIIALGLLLCLAGIVKTKKKRKSLEPGVSGNEALDEIALDQTVEGTSLDERFAPPSGQPEEDVIKLDETFDEIIKEDDSNEIDS